MNLAAKIKLGGDAIDAQDDKFDPEVRAKYMNASEALGCIRRQWYSKHQPALGAPQEWGFARRGRHVEKYVVECMLAAGVDLRLGDDDQEGLYSDAHRISATPDGVVVTNEALIGTEFKSIDPRTNRSRLPKKEHVAQLQIGMALVDLVKEQLGLPDLPFTHGEIVYTNASDYDDNIGFRVPFNPTILDDLRGRADRILDSASASRLPREGKTNGYECNYCAFKAACKVGPAVSADAAPATVRKNSRLAVVVDDYLSAKSDEDDAKQRKTEASERIKSELEKRKTGTAEVNGRTVKLAPVSGRKTLDRKAVEAAGIDLTPFEKVGAPSERLTVQ